MLSIKIIVLSLLFCFGSTSEKVFCMEEQSQEENQGFIWNYILGPAWNGVKIIAFGALDFFVVKPVTFMRSLVKELIFGVKKQPEPPINQQQQPEEQSEEEKKEENDDSIIKEDIQKAIAHSLSGSSDNSNVQNINEIGTTKLEEQEAQDLATAIELSKNENNPQYFSEDIIIEEDFLAQDDEGNTSLHRAIKDSNQEEVQRILINAAEQEKVKDLMGIQNNNAQTPLHLAVANNNRKAIDSIIKAYPDSIRIKNNFNQTAPELAEKNKEENLAKQMRTTAANSRNSQLSLINAILDNSHITKAEVRQLINNGASFEESDENGNNPLHIAIIFSANSGVVASIFDIAQEQNKNLLLIANNSGKTPLHSCARYCDAQRLINIVNYLQASNDDAIFVSDLLKLKDFDGNTPLHIAAQYGKTDDINTLSKEYQESFSIQNNQGFTPNQLAPTNE